MPTHTRPCAISRLKATALIASLLLAAWHCTWGSLRCCQKSVTPYTTAASCTGLRKDSGSSRSPKTMLTTALCHCLTARLDSFLVTPRNFHLGCFRNLVATDEPWRGYLSAYVHAACYLGLKAIYLSTGNAKDDNGLRTEVPLSHVLRMQKC